MSDEFGNEEVVFLKVDVEECPDAAAKYSVKAMPTFVSSVFCLLLLLSIIVVVVVVVVVLYFIYDDINSLLIQFLTRLLIHIRGIFVFSFLLLSHFLTTELIPE